MELVVGIDPGLEGGIAVMQLNGSVLATYRMPLCKGKRETMDAKKVLDIIEYEYCDVRLVGLELIQPMGGTNGAIGMASLIKSCGVIIGLCVSSEVALEEVPPKAWQKLLIGVPRPDRPKKTNVKKADEKAAQEYRKKWKAEIMKAAARRWPDADLVASTHPSAKESSGVSDALWIAEFARLRVVGALLPILKNRD